MKNEKNRSEYESGGRGTGNHKGNNLLKALGVGLAFTVRRQLWHFSDPPAVDFAFGFD